MIVSGLGMAFAGPLADGLGGVPFGAAPVVSPWEGCEVGRERGVLWACPAQIEDVPIEALLLGTGGRYMAAIVVCAPADSERLLLALRGQWGAGVVDGAGAQTWRDGEVFATYSPPGQIVWFNAREYGRSR